MLSRQLWSSCLPLAEACREHDFLRGIATGDLRREVFQHYVAQDAFFLEAFARAYAFCIAKAPEREGMREFKLLFDAVEDELELHRAYACRWGVDLAPEPTEATRAYTEFLLRVASQEPVGHAAAAMAPCMRLYAWLGQELEPIVSSDSPYSEWVDAYASSEFEDHAATLERLLDESHHDRDTATRYYATAMRLELAFFESALSAP